MSGPATEPAVDPSPQPGLTGRPAPAPVPAPPVPSPPPAPAAITEATKVEELPDWAQKMIADTRKGEAAQRVKLRETETSMTAAQEAAAKAETDRQATLDAIAKALGLKPEDTPPDPAQLAEQLAAAQAAADKAKTEGQETAAQEAAARRQVEVQLAVYRNAGKHGGDSDALLDSATFLNAVADLDPKASDFAALLGTAITTAIEANPRLKAEAPKPSPGRSSTADPTPSPAKPRATSLTAAVAKAYGS